MNNLNLENRAQKMNYKGKDLIFMDYSNLNIDQVLDLSKISAQVIRKEPLNSVLLLVDVTDARFNSKIIDELKSLSKDNKPFVKKTAIVGVNNFKKILFNAIVSFAKRDLKLFNNLEESKDWLILE